MSEDHMAKQSVRSAIGAVAATLTLFGLIGDGQTANAQSAYDESAPLADLVPEKYRQRGVLSVGTQPDFEPLNFTPVGEKGIRGYNIDLMEAMADKLGLDVEWNRVPFDQLLIGIESKKYDATIAGMTDRKSRQEQVDFIDYQLAGTVFVVAKGNPKGITGALTGGCGITVAGVRGSDAKRLVDLMAAACIAEGKEPTKLVTFPTTSDTSLALTSGRADAKAYPDMAISVLLRETGDAVDYFPIEFEPKVYLGMTFNKTETELRDAVLAALGAIHEDGTYDKILTKWDVEVIRLEEFGINLAEE
ncbi:ABC transporter substrate-binding protein [uncultured Nitratireductor sp.]|uniref:ABC transporter substrate-binding protein n=1 Tax=uncultured Nitratireductor sp. TaxID=520953 RepID=UPI002603F469|nr:ABC transporter substrate-binding protein [uncultured Nitratireductor sp.]